MSDKVAEIPQDVKDKIEKEYPFPERTYYRGAGFSGWPETERMRKVREGAEFGYSLAQQEIERLKGLIEKAFKECYILGRVHPGNNKNKDWELFKTENNL